MGVYKDTGHPRVTTRKIPLLQLLIRFLRKYSPAGGKLDGDQIIFTAEWQTSVVR